MAKSKMMRVDLSFYEDVRKLADKKKKSAIEITRELIKKKKKAKKKMEIEGWDFRV